jgi:predicted acyl esterase
MKVISYDELSGEVVDMWRRRFVLVCAVATVGIVATPVAAAEAKRPTEPRVWVEGPETPAGVSEHRYEVRTEDVEIPMRDGQQLVARLYLPIRDAGAAPDPCVVSTNGYGPPSILGEIIRDWITGAELDDLARRGYAGAFVFLRGGDVPGGAGELYPRYAEDGYDVVEWMASQPWCDGDVGMIGTSLSGISQWLTAREGPPSLKAIVPKVACGDCYWNLWFRGGALPGADRRNRVPPTAAYDEYAAAAAHRDYDAWWRARDTTPADHRRIARDDIAVMHVGGWDDYIHAGGARATEEVLRAGGDGMLVIGPWDHDTASTTADGLLPYDMQTLTTLWFDRYLRGERNGVDRHEALVFVEGPDRYRFERHWPIRDAEQVRLHLRAQRSGSATSLNDGALTSRAAGRREAPVAYAYDPAGPLNYAGAGTVRPAADQRADETHSLTWTTRALARPTEVTGWPELTFWARSTAPDTDFVVELTDVAPDGTSTQVGRGWLNGPRAESRSHPRPLKPHRTYRFDVELWPVSHVFAAGHRIRVSLSGSDSGLAPNPNPSTVTVLQEARHRSVLELPVIDAD